MQASPISHYLTSLVKNQLLFSKLSKKLSTIGEELSDYNLLTKSHLNATVMNLSVLIGPFGLQMSKPLKQNHSERKL